MKQKNIKIKDYSIQLRERKKRGIYFPVFVIILYLCIFIFNPIKALESLMVSGKLFLHLIPIFLLILFFMGIINYFVDVSQIRKYVGKESGLKGWLIVTIAGILSHGSIYMWYPFLRDLREHGMRSSLVAVFLYTRAVKITLLPIMIYYFGLAFVAVLTIYMVIASIVEGKIIEIIEK